MIGHRNRWARPASALGVVLIFAVPAVLISAEPQTMDDESFTGRLDQIRTLIDLGNTPEAENDARELLVAAEAAFGSESQQVGEVLDLLVDRLLVERRARDDESLALARRALALKEKQVGPEHPEVADKLFVLGELLRSRAEYSESRKVLDRAVEIAEAVRGPDHADVARYLNSLGATHWVSGDYEGARPILERALAISEAAFDEDDPRIADVTGNLAVVAWKVRDYVLATRLYERTLEIYEKAYGPVHRKVARTLGNFALTLSAADEDERAIEALRRSIAITEELDGSDSVNLTMPLNNLGYFLFMDGDYESARLVHERALAIRENHLGPAHPHVGYSLRNLGAINAEIGDIGVAQELFERALAIDEQVFGPESPEVGGDLKNLADVYLKLGEYDRAIVMYRRAAILRGKTLGGFEVSDALMGLADALIHVGELEEARVAAERAVALEREAPSLEPMDEPDSLRMLAAVLMRAGEAERARVLSEQVLAIEQFNNGANHFKVGEVSGELAALYAALGQRDKALDAAVRAAYIGNRHIRLTIRPLPESQALGFASKGEFSGVDVALTLFAEASVDEEAQARAVLDAIVRSRAVVLDEIASRHLALSRSTDPEVERLIQEWSSARQRLARLVVRGHGRGEAAEHRETVEEVERRTARLERELAQKSAAFRREFALRDAGLDEICSWLPAGSALVSFVRYERQLFDHQNPVIPPPSVPSYMAFVLVDPATSPTVLDLGEASEIDGMVVSVRERHMRAATLGGRSTGKALSAYRATANELRRRIWDPVRQALDDARQVFLIPDGSINLVNIAALPAGGTEYVIDRGRRIHYLSAERDLLGGGSGYRGSGLLAVGAPGFDDQRLFASLAPPGQRIVLDDSVRMAEVRAFRGARSTCGDFLSLWFEPLPASGKEVDEIADVWSSTAGDHRNRASEHGLVTRLLGVTASEGAVKVRAPGQLVLHLATHGFFVGSSCSSALDRGAQTSAGARQPASAGENPLLLSGLALAGANHRNAAGPDEEDGILTAEEIASLDLSSVEWAVLSACDTGVGEVRAGEGVFGLRRAFRVAGARTLIMSLWPVEDEATHAWMRELYTNRFVKGMTTSDSVHEASLALLNQRREAGLSTHPLYWAGFIASGDWR